MISSVSDVHLFQDNFTSEMYSRYQFKGHVMPGKNILAAWAHTIVISFQSILVYVNMQLSCGIHTP